MASMAIWNLSSQKWSRLSLLLESQMFWCRPVCHRFWPVIDSALRAAACSRQVQVRLLVSCWNHSPGSMFTFLQSLLVLNRPPLKCNIDVVSWFIYILVYFFCTLNDCWWSNYPSKLFYVCRKSLQCLQLRNKGRFPLRELIMPSTWLQTEWST